MSYKSSIQGDVLRLKTEGIRFITVRLNQSTILAENFPLAASKLYFTCWSDPMKLLSLDVQGPWKWCNIDIWLCKKAFSSFVFVLLLLGKL